MSKETKKGIKGEREKKSECTRQGQGGSTIAEENRMATGGGATLAQLKQVCKEFEVRECQLENKEKRWKVWLENFECCLEFEGIEEDKKKRAALLAVAGASLRELFRTLEEEEPHTYATATKALGEHFEGKKNLTAERYRFLCMKPESKNEPHDIWITRLKTAGSDCEWDNMNLKEAIKLAVTMHTNSSKLQQEIIAQDMTYEKMVEKARAIELTRRETDFINSKEEFKVEEINRGHYGKQEEHNQWQSKSNYRGVVNQRGRGTQRGNSYASKEGGGKEGDRGRICRSCGFKRMDRHDCPARQAICHVCQKGGHYARMCINKKGINQI